MAVSTEEVAAALRLPAGSAIDIEPLGMRDSSPVRAAVREPDGKTRVVLARALAGSEEALNHAAVLEALASRGYPHAPRLLAVTSDVSVEEWVDGLSALALVPPPGSAEAAIEALAALHVVPVREGLDWDESPADVLPAAEVPLHRLGFAAAERDPARGPLAAAHEALVATPFGFAHRDATAANVLLAPARAWLVGFGRAGFGPQLFDVAAFLLTSGLDAPARAALAARYAQARDLPRETVDLVDLAGIVWGLNETLALPRRQVELLGDDANTEALRTAALRIERGVRAAAGGHPAAFAIRSALWPAYHPPDE